MLKRLLVGFFLITFTSGFSDLQEKKEVVKELPKKEKKFPWTIKGDFLCWNAHENGMEYVFDDLAAPQDNFLLTDEMKLGKMYWRGGFRVAVGYTFEPDQWQFLVQYGNFDPWHREDHMQHEGRFFQGIFPEFPLEQVQRATSYLSLRTHSADLFLQRMFAPTPYIHLTLINGLSAIWFRQRWEVNYFDTLVKTANRLNIKNDWNFKGGGPKFGLDMDWLIKWGLGIHSRICGAAFFGNYDNRVNFRSYPFAAPMTYIIHTHYDDFRTVTQLQFLLGPSWEWAFHAWKLYLFAGFELNSFFGIQEVDRPIVRATGDHNDPTTNYFSGQLYMQGLTTTLSIQF